MLKTLKRAKEISGKISTSNTKMPGSCFAADSFACRTGSKLSEIDGSICRKCYARNIQKLRPTVDKGWRSNQTFMVAAPFQNFVDGLTFQIKHAAQKTGVKYHRWFDSGDLFNIDTLCRIAAIANATPKVRHWLPTREAKTVTDYIQLHGDASRKISGLPKNLCIRISSTMVDDAPRKTWGMLNTSTVHSKHSEPFGTPCDAASRGGKCGPCRKCWNKSVPNISYPLHR